MNFPTPNQVKAARDRLAREQTVNRSKTLNEADELVRLANATIRPVDACHWLMTAADLYERSGMEVTAKFTRQLAAERLAKIEK